MQFLKNNYWYYLCVLIFFLKLIFISLFINPLYSIPDEIGHLNYILDIYEQNWSPIKNFIRQNTANFIPPNTLNWIEQHPPIYHLFSSFSFHIIDQLNLNNDLKYKSLRINSAFWSSLFLIFLYLNFSLLKIKKPIIIFVISLIAFNPMFVHMSSGINHDTFLLLLCTLAIYFYLLFNKTENINFLYLMSLFLSLGSLTKITFYIPHFFLLIGVILMIFMNKKTSIVPSIINILPLLVINALPLIWIIKNLIYYDSFFAHMPFSNNFNNITIFNFFNLFPVDENLFRSFIGLFGWLNKNTTDINNVTWIFLDDFYNSILLILTFFILIVLIYSQLKESQFNQRIIFTVILFISLSMYFYNTPKDIFSLVSYLCSLSLVILFVISSLNQINFKNNHQEKIIEYLFIFIFFIFLIVLIFNLMKMSQHFGVLRATHGRYFYPVLPFLLVSIGLSFNKLNNFLTFKVLPIVSSTIFSIYFYNFLYIVIPFYKANY